MGTFQIGEAQIELEPIGAGVRNGWLPESEVYQWDLTLDEARDLAAFQAAGWQFLGEPEINWGLVREKNAADVEAGLLMRHAWGGLVIVRNHVIIQLPPGMNVPPLDTEFGTYRPVPFADDLVDLHLRLPASNLEARIRQQLAFIHAMDGSLVCEPLVSYHLVPHGVVVNAKTEFKQWHWDKVELRKAWNIFGSQGAGVRVAVIDLGFHPDEREISPNVAAYVDDLGKYVPSQAVPPDEHGTLCAGLVGALDDGNGVHGAVPASSRLLIAVQSVTTQMGVAGAITLATKGPNGNDGADVITCSLGPNARPWELSCILKKRIDEAHAMGRNKLGIPIFWADFDADKLIPSRSLEDYSGIVCVGHTNRHDEVAPCGSGPGLDLMAPGVALPTIIRNGAEVMVGLSYGASVAAPCAAGVAALILSMKPGLTSQQVTDAVMKGCDPPPQQGQSKVRIDNIRGWGRLNAFGAMQFASTL